MFLCCLLFNFSFYESLGFNLNELPKADTIVNTVLDKTLMELRTKYPLSIIGVGSGQEDKKRIMIGVSFLLNQSLSKDECRELLVDITEVLLKNINQSEDLQPYLYNLPFSYKNMNINVFLRHPDCSDINYPDISVFSLMKGVVGYDIDDPKIRYRYSTEEEPYEKALQIVQAQRRERTMTTPESPPAPIPNPEAEELSIFQWVYQKFNDLFK